MKWEDATHYAGFVVPAGEDPLDAAIRLDMWITPPLGVWTGEWRSVYVCEDGQVQWLRPYGEQRGETDGQER